MTVAAVMLGATLLYQWFTGDSTDRREPRSGTHSGAPLPSTASGRHSAESDGIEGSGHGSADEAAEASLAPETSDRLAEPGLPIVEDGSLAPALAVDLIRELALMKPEGERFSPGEVAKINRRIRELQQLGQAALPAIRDFLESKADVLFAERSGETRPDHGTLRIALFDSLTLIPVREALDLMAETVQITEAPEQIAVLAKGLEQRAPRVYRQEIVGATRKLLAVALQGDPQAYRDLGPLFGLVQDYGDASVAADLEAVYRQAGSAWIEYSLMALSRLRGGQGLPSLISIADSMSEDGAQENRYYMVALRMLAQTSRRYPEAGDALLQMARANKIATPALINAAATLGGAEYVLATDPASPAASGGSPISLNWRAPETWSDDEIDERLAFIEQMLGTDPEPAAVTALQNAQRHLLEWKSIIMVNGKRLRL